MRNYNDIINQRNSVVRGLDGKVEELSTERLITVDDPRNWQPADLLPDYSLNDWEKNVVKVKKESSGLPAELLIVLVGNMITEEALPTYQTLLNRISSTRDLTGTHQSAWGKWTRGWTAEENRHGDVLNVHLYNTARVEMRAVQDSTQLLITSGFDPGVGDDPYKLLVYTSFQELATHISHLGTAQIAKKSGAETLYVICNRIAKDESRHYSFYKDVMKEVFLVDPNNAMTAYAWMMKRNIRMPAEKMATEKNPDMFKDFSEIAQAIGIYTAEDYSGIIARLNTEWRVANLDVTTDDAKNARDYLVELPSRYLNVARRRAGRKLGVDVLGFGWLK